MLADTVLGGEPHELLRTLKPVTSRVSKCGKCFKYTRDGSRRFA